MTNRVPIQLVQEWRETLCRKSRWPRGAVLKSDTVEQKIKILVHKTHLNIRSLWSTYSMERDELGARSLMTPAMANAYFLGFHLPNAARCFFLWNRFFQKNPGIEEIFQNGVSLDLGAGTGAMTHGFFHALGKKAKWTAHLVDQNRLVLDYGIDVLKQDDVKVNSIRAELARFRVGNDFAKPAQTLVIHLGYLVNELHRYPKNVDNLLRTIQIAASRFESVALTIQDSAQQRHARFLQELRHRLIEELELFPVLPCPSATKTCPMLDSQKDWCFSEFEWNPPNEMKYVDRFTKLQHEHLATSAYIFVNQNILDKIKTAKKDVVVGFPVSTTTKKSELLVCNGDKLLKKSFPERRVKRGESL